ncbi:MAG: right-handed parallel beta-helix repeat-containing protein, partial [Lentisphaerae bacterium]|nr:right-handed parallel beta-helix repeat-containing protein [Lentisphaerota bacterium]
MIARTSQLFFTCIQLFLLGALPLASLADLYVSASGTYDGQAAYVDLQAAIQAAPSGATIWVEDGFVCETGKTDLAENACRILIDKAVTVRSRSGTLQNPAVIRGAWHDPANEIPLGVHAIRCVRMTSSNARLIGFRLEGGATADSDDWTATAGSGGGFLGSGVLSNCLITANQAASGGGLSASGVVPALFSCVISNNVAKLNAGGVKSANCVNTTIVGNHSDGSCGGFRTINASACLIVGNVAATSGGGGIAVGNTFTDCVVTNNEAGTDGGGIHYTPTLFRCLVGWNRAAGAGGGVHGGASTAPVVAYDSTFVGNRAGGSGGG